MKCVEKLRTMLAIIESKIATEHSRGKSLYAAGETMRKNLEMAIDRYGEALPALSAGDVPHLLNIAYQERLLDRHMMDVPTIDISDED